MNEPKIDRVFEPSRVRRGRTAVNPVWYVTLASGQRWRFQRKRDAQDFAAAGGCLHGIATLYCARCGGYPLAAADGRGSSNA